MKVYIIEVYHQGLNDAPFLTKKHILPSFSEALKTFDKVVKMATKERFEEFGRRKSIGGPWEQYKKDVPFDGHGVYTLHRIVDCEYLHVVCKTGELTEDPEE